MKIIFSILFLTAVTALAGFSVKAQTCVVADPTDTPLNVRATPNGRVTGKLRNGTVVHVKDFTFDETGREWVRVSVLRKRKYVVLGYVIWEFIDCR
jgi:hypothetical protein